MGAKLCGIWEQRCAEDRSEVVRNMGAKQFAEDRFETKQTGTK